MGGKQSTNQISEPQGRGDQQPTASSSSDSEQLDPLQRLFLLKVLGSMASRERLSQRASGELEEADWEHFVTERKLSDSSSDVYSARFYFGKIDNQRTLKVLSDRNLPKGSFLVRDSTSLEGALCLAVKRGIPGVFTIVYNVRIVPKISRGQLLFESSQDGTCCRSVTRMIRHYQETGIHLSDGSYMKLGHGVINTSRNNVFDPQLYGHWEISEDDITEMRQELGRGNFGEVCKGQLRRPDGTTVTVALKKIKRHLVDPKQLADFQKEVEVLRMVNDDNIVTFLGACKLKGEHVIVTEFMAKGDLLKHLKGLRTTDREPPDLYYYALKVAAGMVFLENMLIVHRDLAARNVLLGEYYMVKIADFGLGRLTDDGVYRATSTSTVPLKWTAPEGITRRIFTSKSDVWSYGILLTELVTFGKEPYATNSAYCVNIHLGYIALMEKEELGEFCSDEVYKIMRNCWEFDPSDRPNFSEIYESINGLYQCAAKTEL